MPKSQVDIKIDIQNQEPPRLLLYMEKMKPPLRVLNK
jgi:hypothetical protein